MIKTKVIEYTLDTLEFYIQQLDTYHDNDHATGATSTSSPTIRSWMKSFETSLLNQSWFWDSNIFVPLSSNLSPPPPIYKDPGRF